MANYILIEREDITDCLRRGDSVKIGLSSDSLIGATEKFWVIIDEIVGDGSFIGLVDNDLHLTHEHGYKDGDRISFKKSNILEIW